LDFPVIEGEWDSWSDWSLCSVEGFQIRRRKCKVQPCTGERLQERNCQPTSGNCEGQFTTMNDSTREGLNSDPFLDLTSAIFPFYEKMAKTYNLLQTTTA